MASERAKELAAKQKAQRKAEKLRKKNSDNPKDWGRMRQFSEVYKQTRKVDPKLDLYVFGAAAGVAALGLPLMTSRVTVSTPVPEFNAYRATMRSRRFCPCEPDWMFTSVGAAM